MNDDSYYMSIWIGISIRITIGKIFSSVYVFSIKTIGKSGIGYWFTFSY